MPAQNALLTITHPNSYSSLKTQWDFTPEEKPAG